MAAPLGFKTFNSGDVLTAADTNGYLMQGVWTFADATARTAAVTSPQEGNVSFLKDTNSLEIYDGAAWVAYGSGDITGVTAGTGISGGGTSGTVTVTNSMATAIDAKGDLIAGTGADAFTRLAVGSNGQVLTAASGETTGLQWTTISAGAQTVITSGSFSGTTNLSLSSFGGYKDLRLIITGAYTASSANYFNLTVNGLSSGIWNSAFTNSNSSTVTNNENIGNISLVEDTTTGTNSANTSIIDIYNYTESSNAKVGNITAITYSNSNSKWIMRSTGFGVRVTAAITSMNIQSASGMQGSYQLIGIK